MTFALIFLTACFLLIAWTVWTTRSVGVAYAMAAVGLLMGLTTALERGRTADVIICLVYAAAMAAVGFLRTRF